MSSTIDDSVVSMYEEFIASILSSSKDIALDEEQQENPLIKNFVRMSDMDSVPTIEKQKVFKEFGSQGVWKIFENGLNQYRSQLARTSNKGGLEEGGKDEMGYEEKYEMDESIESESYMEVQNTQKNDSGPAEMGDGYDSQSMDENENDMDSEDTGEKDNVDESQSMSSGEEQGEEPMSEDDADSQEDNVSDPSGNQDDDGANEDDYYLDDIQRFDLMNAFLYKNRKLDDLTVYMDSKTSSVVPRRVVDEYREAKEKERKRGDFSKGDLYEPTEFFFKKGDKDSFSPVMDICGITLKNDGAIQTLSEMLSVQMRKFALYLIENGYDEENNVLDCSPEDFIGWAEKQRLQKYNERTCPELRSTELMC